LLCDNSVWPCGQYASPKSTTSSQSKTSSPKIEVIGAGLVGRGADRPGTEPGARPVGRGDVERGSDDRGVGSPRLELADFGQERTVPERHHSGVGQFELLGHAGRNVALVIVLVAHAMTVPLAARSALPKRPPRIPSRRLALASPDGAVSGCRDVAGRPPRTGPSIGTVTALTLNRSERIA
jgi:hypothetical protein